MPNRMLRDWTNSDKVNSLSHQAEVFFTRLIMKVDDYGCFYADIRLLKANLFPLRLEKVREADIPRWMAECQTAGLIRLYSDDQKKYLQIVDFRQRLDKARAKFPLPVNESPEPGNESPAEIEVEYEVEVEEKKKRERGAFAPPALQDVIFEMAKKLDEFSAMGQGQQFINHYTSNGWMVGKNKMKDWPAAARGWISRMGNYQPKKLNGSRNIHERLQKEGHEKV